MLNSIQFSIPPTPSGSGEDPYILTCILSMTTKHTSERRIYTFTNRERVNQGDWMDTGTVLASDQTIFSSHTGVQNPDWWRMVRYKQNATTIASGTLTRLLVTPMTGYAEHDFGTQQVERSVDGNYHMLLAEPPPGEISELSASVRNVCVLKFLNRCLATQRKFQGGVVLGELLKTYRLIRNPLNSLDKLITDYARNCRKRLPFHGNPTIMLQNARRIARVLNEEYLSFTYGVKPLISDIEGAYNAALRLRDLPQTEKVTGYFEDFREVTSSAGTGYANTVPFHYEKQRYVKASLLIKGEVKVASVGPLPPLMEATGFRWRDFVPTVYELIPYSFLLDYVTNVGDLLNALSFCQADLAWHTKSFRTIGVAKIFISPNAIPTYLGNAGDAPMIGYDLNPCYAEHSIKSFTRDAQSLGLPSLAFRMPGAGQVTNVASLLAARAL